jgi:hypothetical protein
MKRFEITVFGILLLAFSVPCFSSNPLSTYEYNSSEYEEPLTYIFFGHRLPSSAKVSHCVKSEQKDGNNFNGVYACSININPEDFSSLFKGIVSLKGEGSLKCLPVSRVELNIKVPKINTSIKVSEMCTSSPEKIFDINESVIYTNSTHSEILAYHRVFIISD